MKISFITNGLTSGGSERVLSLLANKMSARGHDVDIISVMTTDVFYDLKPSVKLLFMGKEAKSELLIKKLLWLRKYIVNERPDVVIAFLQRVYCFTILSLLCTGVPVISSERNDPKSYGLFYKALMKVLLPFSAHHIVQTDDVKQYFSKSIQRKTSIILNPVVDEVFSVNDVDKQDVIINIGRLVEQKNQEMLIRAFSMVSNEYPTWKLYIYGEGRLKQQLENLISTMGLMDRVLLKGRSSDIINEMNQSRIFALSSNYEGLSNAMIESLCLGLPIVTTDVSGAKEIVEVGKNGYVVGVGDTKNFAEALKLLMSNPKQELQFSKNNKEKGLKFQSSHIVDEWEKLITQIVRNNS